MPVLSRRTISLSLLYILPFGLALLSFAWLGSYSRMIADDYCTAATGITYGVFGSVKYYYETWSGTHILNAVLAFLAPFQPGVHIILPGAVLLLWWLTLVWLAYEISLLLKAAYRRYAALILGTVGLYAIASTVPSDQALYWFASLLPYTLPCAIQVLYVCIVMFLLRQPQSTGIRIAGSIASIVIPFIAAGMRITNAVFQIEGMLLLFVIIRAAVPDSPRKTSVQVFLVVGLLASGLSMLLELMAPGNQVRMQAVLLTKDYVAGDISLPLLILLAYAFAVQITITPATVVASLIVFLTAACLSWRLIPAENTLPWKRIQRYFNLSLPVAWTVAAVIIAVPLYGVGHPSPRSLVVVRMWQVVVVAWWGWVVGQTLQRRGRLQGQIRGWTTRRWLVAGIVIGMLAVPLNTLRHNLVDLLPPFSAYATAWDTRHEQIRQAAAAGEESVDISVQPTFMEDYFQLDNLTVWQGCAGDFYGIRLNILEAVSETDDTRRNDE